MVKKLTGESEESKCQFSCLICILSLKMRVIFRYCFVLHFFLNCRLAKFFSFFEFKQFCMKSFKRIIFIIRTFIISEHFLRCPRFQLKWKMRTGKENLIQTFLRVFRAFFKVSAFSTKVEFGCEMW